MSFSPQSGDAKDAVRKEVWALFAQICCLYEPPRLFGYVADGLNSKNVKQRRGEDGLTSIHGIAPTGASNYSRWLHVYVHFMVLSLSTSPCLVSLI